MPRRLTGILKGPGGTLLKETVITFTAKLPNTPSLPMASTITETTDASTAEYDITLEDGIYYVDITLGDDDYRQGVIQIEPGDPTTIFDLIGAIISNLISHTHAEYVAAITAYDEALLKNYAGLGAPTVSSATIGQMHSGVHSKGLFFHNGDGVVSENTSTSINVTAGATGIRPTNDKTDVLEFLAWDVVAAQDITALLATGDVYVYLDYANGATLQFSNANPDPTDEDQTIILLAEIHPNEAGTAIEAIHDTREYVGNHPQEFSLLHRNVFGVLVSGQASGETGARNITIGAGTFHAHGYNNHDVNAFDTSDTDTFIYWYGSEASGWTQVPGSTQIDNLQYNDGTNLVALGNNKWKKDWVFRSLSGAVHVVYSPDEYTGEQNAIDAPIPDLPPRVAQANHSHILSNIRVVKDGSTLTILDIANRFAGGGAALSDHGSLTGLGDTQDHPWANFQGVPGNLTVGHTTDKDSLGEIAAASTLTPNVIAEHMKRGTVAGDFTLARPTSVNAGVCKIELIVTGAGGYTMLTTDCNIISGEFDGTSGAQNLITVVHWDQATPADIKIEQRP